MVEGAISEAEASGEPTDPGFTHAQQNVVDTMAVLAEERGREIQIICENITELAAVGVQGWDGGQGGRG